MGGGKRRRIRWAGVVLEPLRPERKQIMTGKKKLIGAKGKGGGGRRGDGTQRQRNGEKEGKQGRRRKRTPCF